jgi:hypothetical protein
LVNSAKRYVAKPEFRIQLDELFSKEGARLLDGLDVDQFPPSGKYDVETFRLRLKKYESLTEPLACMAGVLGRWGDDSELPIVLAILQTVRKQAESVGNGLNHFLNVRAYPAVLVFTAYGLGLTRSERWRTLHRLFATEVPHDGYPDHSRRMVEVLFLWSWRGGTPALWQEVLGEARHTPLSDHLFALFKQWSANFVGLTPDFELLFDRFELLASIAHFENRDIGEVKKQIESGRIEWGCAPVGRSIWRQSGRAYQGLRSEMLSDPTKTALINAHFAKRSADFLQLYFDYNAHARLY